MSYYKYTDKELTEIALQRLLKDDRAYYKDDRYKLYTKCIEMANRPIIGYENDNHEKWYIKDVLTGDLLVDWEMFDKKEVFELRPIRTVSDSEIDIKIANVINEYESYYNVCEYIKEANRTQIDEYYLKVEFWITLYDDSELTGSVIISFK